MGTRFAIGAEEPLAVFGCDGGRAMFTAEAAALLDLNVPEEVAILGVNNDEIRCLATWPPTSSLRLPARLQLYAQHFGQAALPAALSTRSTAPLWTGRRAANTYPCSPASGVVLCLPRSKALRGGYFF